MPKDLESIPEYLYLRTADATTTGNNQFTWYITNYMTNNRGRVCYVELCNAILVPFTQVDAYVVVYDDFAKNCYSSSNSYPAIGFIKCNTDNATEPTYSLSGGGTPIQLLVNERPNKISLSIYDNDLDASNITSGIFVLKFTYLNSDDTERGFLNTQYKSL